MEYMPDYAPGEFPERDFFFNVLSTLYPKEIHFLVDASYKARQLHFKKVNDEMIELSSEIKKLIEPTVINKSKYFCSHRLLVTAGSILWMLKKKSQGV